MLCDVAELSRGLMTRNPSGETGESGTANLSPCTTNLGFQGEQGLFGHPFPSFRLGTPRLRSFRFDNVSHVDASAKDEAVDFPVSG